MKGKTFLTILASGPGDATAPTVTITSTETSPSAANPIPLTFTLSEVSTNFAVGDITVGAGGSIGNFAGSGTSYTADLTVTTAGATITVDVAADAFTDAAGNGNTAATQFSITSGLQVFDQFTTNASAPLTSPRTCEPGPGTLTVTDVGNVVTITSNRLTVAADSVARNRGVNSASLAHAAGRGIFVTATAASNRSDVGLGSAFGNNAGGVFEVDANIGLRDPGGASVNSIYTSPSLPRQFGIIRSQTGLNYYLANSKLYWVSGQSTKSTAARVPWVMIGAVAAWTGSFDNLKICDLGAPWTTDFGIATSSTASPSTGTTATQEANALVEFTWTAATGETVDFMVRRTDDNNTWIIRCDQTNSKIYLYEKNASVETERGATGGVAQTWTNGTAYRIVVVCNSTTIKVYVNNGNAKVSYTSATFNQSATGVKVSGFATGAYLNTWPIDLSGSALSEVQRVYPF